MSSLPLSSTRALLKPLSLSQVPRTTTSETKYDDNPLDASEDARQIVRMAQCPQCSYPLQTPVTLPCGNSLCKGCVPKLHLRQNISYPATPQRLQGFTCPFSDCNMDHAIDDCEKDVVLNKIMTVVRHEMGRAKEQAEATNILLNPHDIDPWARTGISHTHLQDRIKIFPGGRLLATYIMSELGELPYDAEVIYTSHHIDKEQADGNNNIILHRLKEAIKNELDCQVCYGVFLDPHTTTCGHTFCRKCLQRVLDHSNLCPICRRVQALSPGRSVAIAPSIILSKLINGLCPEVVASRVEAVKDEEKAGADDMDLPLFICALSFPCMPTFLHVFEPRYRLMMRRVVESGDRKFGMLFHNPNRVPQEIIGSANFFEYGTLLHIVNIHLLPNGHSLVETVGVSRFRVLKYGYKDDYTIGKVERVEDIPVTEEEALEAREFLPARTTNLNRGLRASEINAPPENSGEPQAPLESNIENMSTQALFELGCNFIKKMREQSAHWLQMRVFQVYGECPQDPGTFPWWLASILPISEMEKYKLLTSKSVRERLKICAKWVIEIEDQR
ncbi:LON peptidase N-terminal domain and RING finger protein 1 [Golovinomyces cichoracearum]|uniref:LON peptidase N-terminal domain and RING finger protein 1 n=1 Tax=Golovinomyces cichoracearum TaxID=62708 RepID=A0A420IY23_9PEZI|nr:LON peptidase N-terminal domain and RING finger protein 1 [Golovinomyces cichoracearum]